MVVTATDPGNLTDTITVMIYVTDVMDDEMTTPEMDLLERYGGDDGMIDVEEVRGCHRRPLPRHGR